MVGILTFHRAANYGAVLQSYALQKTLDSIGVQNEVIDYRCEHIEKHYSPKPSVSIRHTKHFLKAVSQAPQKAKIRKTFNCFLNDYMTMSAAFSKEDLPQNVDKYNTIICGSDQVWNPLSTNSDSTYFLDFVSDNTRKMSYAASIGISDWYERLSEDNKKNLKSFDAVSIREPDSLELVKKVYDSEILINVDPTVLIEKEEWNEIADASNLNHSKYIFVYVMQPSNELYEVAKKLAKEKGLKIYSISATEKKCKIGKNVKGASVNDFLWFIKNASYVVTNSFHGLIFSMIFEKEFFWNYQQGKSMSNNRLDMLSKQYGIDIRCFSENKKLKDYEQLDYNMIKCTMLKQREASIEYLKNNVRGE